jgi:peptidoglycan/xylan/chitin deacetylase (PgdA/CDA1 family)
MRNVCKLAAFFLTGVAVAQGCDKPVYLTFDTGHLEPAKAILDILDKQQVKATFFVANEKTKLGGWTLDSAQKAFWTRVIQSGHALGSHTFHHHYFQSDVGHDAISIAPWGKPKAARQLSAAAVCEEIKQPLQTLQTLTGLPIKSHIWRAPGGRLSARYEQFAQACGFQHIGWTAQGLLGDELNSRSHPNADLLSKALSKISAGEVTLLHLGIWSREEPLWPILDPLITGLKQKGFCFNTIPEGIAAQRILPNRGRY